MVVAKKRILFISNEMSPYLELTEFAETVNKLAIKSNDNNFEVRCIMPRFGVINERRHRLHEVVRLSGINVSVDNDDYPLQIKVASLRNARLQLYFIENIFFFFFPGDRKKIRLAAGYYSLQRLDDRINSFLPENGL